MVLNKKIKFGNVAPKKSVIKGVGLLFLTLLVLSTLARVHLKKTHRLKIESLEKIRLRLVYAHLERKDSTLTTFKSNHVFDSDPAESLNTFLDVKWDDYLMPLLSQQNLKEIKIILSQIKDFDSFFKQKLTPQSRLEHDAVFNSMIENIKILHIKLDNRAESQNNMLFVIQIILLVILVAWLVITILILKNIRLDRKKILKVQDKLLEKLKRKNYFLEKAQDISKLGYYTYNIHTDEWTASDFILDLVNDAPGDTILRKWKYSVHPDDRDILSKIFYKKEYAGDFSYDVTYRVIRPTNEETCWIHHVAGKLENKNKKEGITVIGVLQDITHTRNLQETIKQIDKSIALKTGKDYFLTLTKALNKILKADYIIIARYNKKDNTSTSLAYLNKQEVMQNITYDLPHTPCQKVLDNGYAFYGAEVAKIFPKDSYLKDYNIASYVGLAVYNTQQQVVGHLVALYCKPIVEEKQSERLMRFFADKIGAEFIRNKLNISLRLKQEELLRSQKLALLGTYTYNIKTDTIESSQILTKISELKPSDLKTLNDWQSLLHPDDLKTSKAIVEKSIKARDTFNLEYRIITKNTQQVKWIHSIGRVVEKEGIATHVMGSMQDITHLKVAELSSKQNAQKLKEAHEITNLGTFTFDSRAQLFKTSLLFNKIIGLSDNSIKNIEEFIKLSPPDDCQYLDELFYDKRITKIKKEFRIQRPKDKTIIWILLHAKKTYSDDFKHLSVTGTIQDITQSKKTREKLKQSDAILKGLNTIVLVNDENVDVIYASPRVRDILGYEPEELLGRGWWNLTYETAEEAKEVQKAVANYLYHDGPKNKRVSYRKIKTKKGTYKHIEWFTSKGVDKTYINIGIDITKRHREEQIKNIIFNITKQAQKKPQLASLLHFIKESLSAVIDTSNFYVALYNAEKQNYSLPYVAGEDAAFIGKTFPIGKSLMGYVLHKAQSVTLTASSFEVLRKKGAVNLVGKTSKIWVGIPLIENNKIIGLMSVQSFTDEKAFSKKDIKLLELIATNISLVIKQAKDYEKINLLNQSLIQSPASIVITNKAGSIEYVNPTFTKLSGYTFEEVVGQNPRILKSGDQDKIYYKNLWNTITAGNTWHGEFVNKRIDNRKYLVSVSISPVKDTSGEITHFIGIQEDITEKRQLERDYLHAFIDAQEQEKQSFGEDLHDGISQILAAEKMYIDILFSQREISDTQRNEFLSKIKEHNLNAIQDTRRIAHGLMSKQLKQKGLLEAIKLICTDYNNSKSITISYKLKDLKESEIDKTIKTNIYRVFQEIITNITRHSGAKKAVISFSKTSKNEFKLLIKDNGVGIDFEKMKRENSGAGLKNIEQRISLLNGKLAIDSILGKGTIFTITVPLTFSK